MSYLIKLDVPRIEQPSKACGATALLQVMKFFGFKKDIDLVLSELKMSADEFDKSGVSEGTMGVYALDNGFKLSPDTRLVKTLLRGMANNLKLYGMPYCPCRRRTGNIKKDKKIVCPCVYHKKEIKKWGHCYC